MRAMRLARPSTLVAMAALASLTSLAACSRSTRPASDEDRAQAQTRCGASPKKDAVYSPELSKAMGDDLAAKCAANKESCERFQGSVVRVCGYKSARAQIVVSEAVEVYASIGANDDLALRQLCGVMRSVKQVGMTDDVDVYVARGGDPYWGKSWRMRCAQGTGSGGEHR